MIPNELKKYWFRGYLDGDGCIKLGKKCSEFLKKDLNSVYNKIRLLKQKKEI